MNYDKRIKITIKLKSPVLITDVPGEQNMVETKLYLTGSSIMGIFADKYISEKKGVADDYFYNSFLRGGLTFTDAFKAIAADKNSLIPSYVLPLSIQKKKHDESGKCVEYFLLDENKQDKNEENNGMKNKYQPVNGFGIINDGIVKTVNVESGISFHSSINNGKQDNDIFNYEWISPFQTFVSSIIGSESNLKTFLSFLKESYQTTSDYEGSLVLNAYIGRSRTAEYGNIEMKISDITDIDIKDIPDILNNDDDLDNLCIMTLLSDAIIYNEYGFSSTDVNDLAKCIGLGQPDKILKSAIRKNSVENFVGKWSARKPMENVIKAGSCFLIERSSLPENYKDFEIYGIGERTNEGFGRVAFNLNVKQNLIKKEYEKDVSTDIRKIPPTNLAKKIIERRISTFIKDQIAIDAIKKANESDSRNITGSLASKLRNFAKAIQEINDFKNFANKINNLRKHAKDKLLDASVDNISMLDFLNEFGYDDKNGNEKLFIKDKVTKILQNSGIKEFLSEINAKNADRNNTSLTLSESTIIDNKNLTQFQKVYLINFFTQLKRKNKNHKNEKK